MLRRFALLLVFLSAAAGSAQASEPWPPRQISIVVGFAAGGNTDMAARMLATGMKAALPVPVVVENKPGAGGTVGGSAVARATPDGSMLLVGSQSETAMLKANRAKPPYDIDKDLVPIGKLMDYGFVVTVSRSLNINSWNEFLAYARQKGSLSYGTPGIGTTAHVMSEHLLSSVGVKGVHVPYQGAASLRPDHIAGRIDFSIDVVPLILPLLTDGQLRPLAVTQKERDARLPSVPTLMELRVFPEEYSGWTGVFAPRGTPPEVRSRLLDLINQTLKGPGGEEIRRNGYRPAASSQTLHEFAQFVSADQKRWVGVFQKAGIAPSP
ncbi:MAG TPA: tripartite tricarboxylate transporter substrate binding protein [Ramlibacter sp.]|nr:tripartite tricarboxylate transporter substrate binding protein [Ramlibacter sp.]